MITHPCPNFNCGLVKPSMKLGHGRLIASHSVMRMWILIHALIPALVQLIPINKRRPWTKWAAFDSRITEIYSWWSNWQYISIGSGHALISYWRHVITCRRCSNNILILDLAPGCNRLPKDNCKMRRETFKFCDLLRLIIEVWWYYLCSHLI